MRHTKIVGGDLRTCAAQSCLEVPSPATSDLKSRLPGSTRLDLFTELPKALSLLWVPASGQGFRLSRQKEALHLVLCWMSRKIFYREDQGLRGALHIALDGNGVEAVEGSEESCTRERLREPTTGPLTEGRSG